MLGSGLKFLLVQAFITQSIMETLNMAVLLGTT